MENDQLKEQLSQVEAAIVQYNKKYPKTPISIEWEPQNPRDKKLGKFAQPCALLKRLNREYMVTVWWSGSPDSPDLCRIARHFPEMLLFPTENRIIYNAFEVLENGVSFVFGDPPALCLWGVATHIPAEVLNAKLLGNAIEVLDCSCTLAYGWIHDKDGDDHWASDAKLP